MSAVTSAETFSIMVWGFGLTTNDNFTITEVVAPLPVVPALPRLS